MKNLFEHETAGNGPAITGGEAGASPAMRTPRRTTRGGRAALALLCVLASLAPLVGCELGFGSVLHKPPSGGDDDGGNGGEPGQRYSITYYLNGGTFGSAAAPSAYTQDSLPLPLLPEPEKAGCEFLGWYDNEDLTGDPVTTIPAGSTGDKTFWAKWREIPYTITLHLNGGDLPSGSGWSKSGIDAAGFIIYTLTYTISSPNITLPEAAYPGNPSFGGWYTDATLLDRAEPPEVPEGSTGNKDFYARYPFTVTFDSNGGSAVPAITALEKDATITEPEKPTKDGYAFDGWYKEAALTNKWDFAADKVGNSDITLYAKWEKIPTITLHLKGGDLSDDDKDDWGAKGGNSSDYTYTREYTESDLPITLPDPVPAAGCSFIGWFTDAACTVSAGTPPEVPANSTGNKVFYAKWFVPVTDITGVPTTMGEGTSITLSGTVSPPDATNRTIVWSVVNAGTTGATISGSTLTAAAVGTVTVRATIAGGTAPGTDFVKDFTVTVIFPYFYRGTAETGELIDISGLNGATLIDKAKTYLAASAEENALYTLVLDADISQAPVALSGLAADNITLVVTTRDDAAERVVELSSNGSLFYVGAAVTLRLDRRVTLSGISGNTAALVEVNSAGTLEATGNAKITGNTNSYGCGGGVYVYGGTFTLSGSASVSGNSTTFGGGVYVLGGTFIMSGGSVSNNTADGNGGGIEIKGTFIMSGGSVSNNTAISGNGGGIHAVDGTSTMSGSATVSGNSAPYGGGVDVTENGTFTMNGSASVWGNTATISGGGVYVDTDGRFTMNGGRIQGSAASGGFTKNTAPDDSAALYKSGGTARFGAASTGCAVGSTGKNAGDDIGTTSETITATGTGS